jgi:hypothetical protein
MLGERGRRPPELFRLIPDESIFPNGHAPFRACRWHPIVEIGTARRHIRLTLSKQPWINCYFSTGRSAPKPFRVATLSHKPKAMRLRLSRQ